VTLKIQPLTYEQALTRISTFYHDVFREEYESLGLAHENILWIGNFSRLFLPQGDLGFVIITSSCLIQVYFRIYFEGIFGGREKITANSIMYGVGLPTYPFTPQEKKMKGVLEVSNSSIYNLSRRVDRIKYRGKEMTLFWLLVETFGGKHEFRLYGLEDGQEMYDTLQSVIPGKVANGTTISDIADQLMKLAELRKNNMITDAEYESAKRKLLA